MGDLPGSKDTARLKPTPPPKPSSTTPVVTRLDDLTARLTQLEEKTTQLQTINLSLHENHIKLEQKHSKLQADYSELRSDYVKVKTENRKWQQEVASLKKYLEAFQEDHTKVLTEQRDLKHGQDNLQTNINNTRVEHQRQINNVRADQQTQINNIKADQQTRISNIRVEQQKNLDDLKNLFAQKIVKEMTSLREEMMSQSCDVASVKDMNSAQQRHTELHTLPQTEVTQIQTDHSKLTTDENDLKTAVKNIQTAQAKLTTDMDRMVRDQKTFQDDMAKLQIDHIDTVLAEQHQLQQNQDTLTADVGTVKTGLEQTKTVLQESLKMAGLEITALKTTLGKARQLFEVGGLFKDRTGLRGQALVFTEAWINEGSHYSEDTGFFIAPHAGLYFFSADVRSHTKDTTFYGYIMVGDARHCAVPGSYGGGSGCMLVPLEAGQKVWVRMDYPGDPDDTLCWWFRGTLVLIYL